MCQDDNSSMAVERIPTGSLGLDIALGGGLPVCRITEIYGPESSGKPTVALLVIACPARRAAMHLDVRGASNVKGGETIIWRDTKVKVVKNKVSPPFR